MEPIRLICDAISPPLDTDVIDISITEPIRFRCQKPSGHSGVHAIRLEWPTDPALFGIHPWATDGTI